MREFGSLKRLRAADEATIAAVPGVPADVAHAVWQALHELAEGQPSGRHDGLGTPEV